MSNRLMHKLAATLIPVTLLSLLSSCVPESVVPADTSIPRLGKVDSIALKSSSPLLLSDPLNYVELTPVLYRREQDGTIRQLPRELYDSPEITIIDASGQSVDRVYRARAGFVGNVTFTARLEGSSTPVSNPITVKVVTPPKLPAVKEIPVIFHVIQGRDELNKLGIKFDPTKIERHLTKLNHLFSGEIDRGAVGVDSRIRFVPVFKGPNGLTLQDPGIDQVILDTPVDISEDGTKAFFEEQTSVQWDHSKYFNIYLFSNFDATGSMFHYIYENLEQFEPVTQHKGVYYVMQDLDRLDRGFRPGSAQTDEISTYIARYMGLLPTNNPYEDDQCADTVDYYHGKVWYGENKTKYKETADHFFLSRNVMDDRAGLHTYISADQAQRLHNALENYPYLSMWRK